MCFGRALTWTVMEAEAAEVACGEVPVTFRMTRVLDVCLGTAILACNSIRCPTVSPATLQVARPAGWHTVKTGDNLRGLAERLIFALPLVPAVSQTQIAYRAWVPGATEPPLSDWTDRHRCAVGGGGVVFVGVGVGDGDLLGVGDGLTVLLGEGCGVPLGLEVAVTRGLELGLPEAVGDAGTTDGLVLGDAEGFGVPACTTSAVRWI